MDYQVSARKYRPARFDDVVGQPHVVQTLMNSITEHRIAHAFLFSGSRGVGKTTVARVLAKALNCEQGPTQTPCDHCANCLEIAQGHSVDVIEIDGASNTSVDDVREIRENIKFTPFRGQYRVYIVDEVHMLSNSAFNALLKTLEEPPAHVVFIFATTEIHKIPSTILSRCQHYNFRRIPRAEIIQRLRYVADQDGVTVEDRSLTAIARASDGSMRDALSLLDQTISFGGPAIQHDHLLSLLGSVPQELIREMMDAVIKHDSPRAIGVIARLLDQGHDLRAFCSELVEHIRNLLVASVALDTKDVQAFKGLIDLSEEEIASLVSDARQCSTDQLQDWFRIFSQTEDTLRVSARPRFALEVAAIRASRPIAEKTSASTSTTATPAATPVSRPPAKGQELRGEYADARTSKPGQPVSTVTADRATRPLDKSLSKSPALKKTDAVMAQIQSVPDPGAPVSTKRQAEMRSSVLSSTPTSPGLSGTPRLSVSTMSPVPLPTLLWEKVVERTEQHHPSIGAFLSAAIYMGFQNGQVTIGYPPTASVALARLQKEEALQAVGTICSQLAGQSVRLSVIEVGEGHHAGPSVAELRAEKERIQKHQLLEQSRSHPLVKETLAIFGGDVIEVRQTVPQEETGHV